MRNFQDTFETRTQLFINAFQFAWLYLLKHWSNLINFSLIHTIAFMVNLFHATDLSIFPENMFSKGKEGDTWHEMHLLKRYWTLYPELRQTKLNVYKNIFRTFNSGFVSTGWPSGRHLIIQSQWNTRTMCEIYSKLRRLPLLTLSIYFTHYSEVSIVYFE